MASRRMAAKAASAVIRPTAMASIHPAQMSPYANTVDPRQVKRERRLKKQAGLAEQLLETAKKPSNNNKAYQDIAQEFDAMDEEQKKQWSKSFKQKHDPKDFLDYKHVKVAIVGRPNVGKSTLFNRLVGRNASMTSSKPGLTRDRLEMTGSIYDLQFTVIDTAGLEDVLVQDMDVAKEKRQLTKDMMIQTSYAIQSADIVLFMVDGSKGITLFDENVADFVRKHTKKDKSLKNRIIFVANKCDPNRQDIALSQDHEDLDYWADVYGLKLGEPVLISAEFKNGFHNLYHELYRRMKYLRKPNAEDQTVDPSKVDDEKATMLQLAIVGRPNSGKSTLINGILDSERLLTGPMPGVTRDPVSIELTYGPKQIPIKLVDTAGFGGGTFNDVRRSKDTDEIAMARSMRAIGFSSVVALTLDSSFCFHVDGPNVFARIPKREKNIGNLALKEGRGLMILLTKFDTIPKTKHIKCVELMTDLVSSSFRECRGLKVIPISKTKTSSLNLDKVLPAAVKMNYKWNQRLSTHLINNWLTEMKRFSFPGSGPVRGSRKGRTNTAPKIKFITQIKTRPPTFAFFGSTTGTDENHPYIKKLTAAFRKEFDLEGIPIRISLRNSTNPYKTGMKYSAKLAKAKQNIVTRHSLRGRALRKLKYVMKKRERLEKS